LIFSNFLESTELCLVLKKKIPIIEKKDILKKDMKPINRISEEIENEVDKYSP
jgi:hypothetical protein